jgi:hypothetical protein
MALWGKEERLPKVLFLILAAKYKKRTHSNDDLRVWLEQMWRP